MIVRRLGRRGPEVTRLGLGCAPLGNLFTAVGDARSVAEVDADVAWATTPLPHHVWDELEAVR